MADDGFSIAIQLGKETQGAGKESEGYVELGFGLISFLEISEDALFQEISVIGHNSLL